MYKYFTELVDFVGSRPKPFDNTKKYISTGALKTNKISEDDIEIIEYANRPSRADLEVKTGDILFAKMAFTDKRLLIGEIEANYIYSTGFFAVKPKEGIITSKCLYYLLNSESFKNQKDINSTGATQKAITIEGLKKINLRIPEYHRQNQIGKTIENIDKIIKLREQQLTEYDQLIKSRFIEMFGDPLANDKKFKTKPLSLACPFNKYKGIVDSADDKYWILNLDMIESNTGRIIEKVYQSLNEIGNSTISFDKECVLYSKLRPYLNKVAIPDTTGYATSELISMKTGDEINKYYLAYLLRNESFVTYINSKTAGAKMPRASMDHLRDFPLMIPEIEMQIEFADFVNLIDKLKFVVQKSLDETQKLFDSLMQEYFG